MISESVATNAIGLIVLVALVCIACVPLLINAIDTIQKWRKHRKIPALCSSCGSPMVNAQWCEYEGHWVCIHCSELLSHDKDHDVMRGCYRCRLQREQKDAETHPRQEQVRLSLSGYEQDAERVRH